MWPAVSLVDDGLSCCYALQVRGGRPPTATTEAGIGEAMVMRKLVWEKEIELKKKKRKSG